jgi:hypothetical protein
MRNRYERNDFVWDALLASKPRLQDSKKSFGVSSPCPFHAFTLRFSTSFDFDSWHNQYMPTSISAS